MNILFPPVDAPVFHPGAETLSACPESSSIVFLRMDSKTAFLDGKRIGTAVASVPAMMDGCNLLQKEMTLALSEFLDGRPRRSWYSRLIGCLSGVLI